MHKVVGWYVLYLGGEENSVCNMRKMVSTYICAPACSSPLAHLSFSGCYKICGLTNLQSCFITASLKVILFILLYIIHNT